LKHAGDCLPAAPVHRASLLAASNPSDLQQQLDRVKDNGGIVI
jgi:hypothetical protein